MKQTPRLGAAVLLLMVLDQVDATSTETGYWHDQMCPFHALTAGDWKEHELRVVIGIPTDDKHAGPYLNQRLCKATCQRPKTLLSAEHDITKMGIPNRDYQCEDGQVEVLGSNINEMLASWNSQVQKPLCTIVKTTVVCIVDTVEESHFVKLFMSVCAMQYNIFVVNPRPTFGNLLCNVESHDDIAVLSNFTEHYFVEDRQTTKSKLFLADKDEADKIILYEKLKNALSAPADNIRYNDILQIRENLCGDEDSGHDTTTMCKSVTADVLKACKGLRTTDVHQTISHVETCVKKKYAGVVATRVLEKVNLFHCGLLKASQVDAAAQACIDGDGWPQTQTEHQDLFTRITTNVGSILNMVNGVYAWSCNVFTPVFYVCNFLHTCFWTILAWFASIMMAANKLQTCAYLGIFSTIVFWIITNSIGFAGGYDGCHGMIGFILRSLYLLCSSPVYILLRCFFGVASSLLEVAGINVGSFDDLTTTCKKVEDRCESMEKQITNVEQSLTVGGSKKANVMRVFLRQVKHYAEPANQQEHVSPLTQDTLADNKHLKSRFDIIKKDINNRRQGKTLEQMGAVQGRMDEIADRRQIYQHRVLPRERF